MGYPHVGLPVEIPPGAMVLDSVRSRITLTAAAARPAAVTEEAPDAGPDRGVILRSSQEVADQNRQA